MSLKAFTVVAASIGFLCFCDSKQPGSDASEANLLEGVEYASLGSAYLEEVGEIKLLIGNGPVIGVVQDIVSVDSSFVLMDVMIAEAVCQYSPDGEYIRTIGAKGKGPGEYLFPTVVSSDATGHIYVQDGGSQRLNEYDKMGMFVRDLNAHGKLPERGLVLSDKRGDLLCLGYDEVREVLRLRKLRRDDLEELFEVEPEPEPEKYRVFSCWNMCWYGFCYNPTTDRIYYIPPYDYRVKEINASTGEITRMFGVKPPHYRPLDEKHCYVQQPYHEHSDDVHKETTLLGEALLLGNTYLLVGFGQPKVAQRTPPYYWLLYDVVSEPLRAFAVDPGTVFFRMVSLGDLVYVCQHLTWEERRTLNAVLKAFALRFGARPQEDANIASN